MLSRRVARNEDSEQAKVILGWDLMCILLDHRADMCLTETKRTCRNRVPVSLVSDFKTSIVLAY